MNFLAYTAGISHITKRALKLSHHIKTCASTALASYIERLYLHYAWRKRFGLWLRHAQGPFGLCTCAFYVTPHHSSRAEKERPHWDTNNWWRGAKIPGRRFVVSQKDTTFSLFPHTPEQTLRWWLFASEPRIESSLLKPLRRLGLFENPSALLPKG